MKTTKFLLLGLALSVFISCSKTDPLPNSDLSSEFAGDWILYTYDYEGDTTTIYPDSATRTTFSGIAFQIVSNIYFSENPNGFTSTGHYGIHQINVDEDGDQSEFFRYVEVNDSGGWTRLGNTITFTLDGEVPLRGFITELTDNTLKIIVNSVTTELLINNVSRSISQTDSYFFVRTPL